MEMFDLEKALAGEPVRLRNGDKAIIIGRILPLCDQIVTAIGVAYMFGMDIQGALKEVADSNDSKFENGEPVFNEQGKIAKGKHYFSPNLKQFI
ncbi:hypothetical protein [Mannheimia indoligenes]|uniref:hypothetical protein n=1 Tax=Mannheimia indoligenes TaxID=3103145 RepID=UPI002FE4FBB1